MDGPQLGLASPSEDSSEAGDDREDILSPVCRIVLERWRPDSGQTGETGPWLLEQQAQVESGAGQERGRSPGEVILQQGELDEVLNSSELVRQQ